MHPFSRLYSPIAVSSYARCVCLPNKVEKEKEEKKSVKKLLVHHEPIRPWVLEIARVHPSRTIITAWWIEGRLQRAGRTCLEFLREPLIVHLADGEGRGSQVIMKDGASSCVSRFVVRVAGRRRIKRAGPFGRWPEFAALQLRLGRRVRVGSRGEERSDVVLDVGVELRGSDGGAAAGGV